MTSFSMHYPAELPITERREEIVRAIKENQVLVVTGETGSGKSTQIPKMCLEAGRGESRLIGCTQPRRIAAITLANRVAEEMGTLGPRLVGYKIRFQDRTARSTRIKFMTDGILLAEAQKDRLFRAYDTIIVDEAHERTLNIDFLLGLIKKILPRRPDLKVIVTSATIDPEKFSEGFGNAPIIEVSGRTYPVDTWYRVPELPDNEGGEPSYADQAVQAVEELKSRMDMGSRGDILVFMPTETDIRETVQRLEERRYLNTLVLPLFGRLAASDQQKVFRLTSEDRIIVATNVAETSITIPRIKYVVDTGLARISQYNARSRTQGLPVVPISQASADQRKGRCGRVASGVCIRLYSNEDYLSRPLFTPPEIQRSNLAEVILRMLYLRLGNIQEFPFLDPPSPAAVKDGYAVLKELGAVDEHRRLTGLGNMMARLPLDPRLSRMLLQARTEGALREVTVLVAALSIQDPRERPLDQEAQADQAHAVFRDPRSDFVSLLKIWQAVTRDELSRSQLRRFCRDHFLSYRRVKEWKDVHEEITSILEEMGGFSPNENPASYEAIHRSILSGYLSHIALRKEKNLYQAAKNRQVMLFPGSGLFNKGGSWIAAAELVQTSRLFARTVADIEPEWLESLGKHLCRSSYSEPHWEKSRGQVVAFERVTLYGLSIVERRKVNYSRINPQEAREIFIRSALVEGQLPGRYGFMEHNRRLIKEIGTLESKTRRRDLLVDDEAVYRFYDSRLPLISDLRSFDKYIKDCNGDDFLKMVESDLLQGEPDFGALEQFPDTIRLGDVELPLRYSFRPGQEDDGVTAVVPIHVLRRLVQDPFEWLVPGLLYEKVALLLKALPKSIRRQLVPVGDTARRLVECLPFREGNLFMQLSRCVSESTGIRVGPDQWDREGLPTHLRMRFAVVGPDGKVLGTGRDLEALKSIAFERHEDSMWEAARKVWERSDLPLSDFGEFPTEVEIGTDTLGLMRRAYLGLFMEGQSLSRRLFADPESARSASLEALGELYRIAFAQELKQLARDWIFPESMAAMIFFMGNRKDANQELQDYLMRELFDLHEPQWPDRRKFQETVQRVKGCIALLGREMAEEVFEALKAREETRKHIERLIKSSSKNRVSAERLGILLQELNDLMPRDFLRIYRRSEIQQLPRYLKALQIRAERGYVAPEKDRIKAEQLAPYKSRYEAMREEAPALGEEEAKRFLDDFRWMLEEFKVSLFSPEIKTRFKISPKRLEEKWQEWLLWKGMKI